jgi:hypothetical protein
LLETKDFDRQAPNRGAPEQTGMNEQNKGFILQGSPEGETMAMHFCTFALFIGACW